MCDVAVTSYVTTCPYFLINYSPHHLFCLEMCDVTTYVTPIVGSLIHIDGGSSTRYGGTLT